MLHTILHTIFHITPINLSDIANINLSFILHMSIYPTRSHTRSTRPNSLQLAQTRCEAEAGVAVGTRQRNARGGEESRVMCAPSDTHVRTYKNTWTHLQTQMCAPTYTNVRTFKHTSAHLHTDMCAPSNTHVRIYKHKCAHQQTRMCAPTNTHMHTYKHTRAHQSCARPCRVTFRRTKPGQEAGAVARQQPDGRGERVPDL